MENSKIIVIDIGSGVTKVGWGGQEVPLSVFPSMQVKNGGNGSSVLLCGGSEANSQRGILKVKYPMERGEVTNFCDWREIVEYSYKKKLKTSPEDHPCILCMNPLTKKENRIKILEIMMDKLQVPFIKFEYSPRNNMAFAGKRTGMCVDIGDSKTLISPVYNGSIVRNAVTMLPLGGRDVTSQLVKVLCERGYEMTTSAEREIVRDIKEKCCYVSYDHDKEKKECEESGKFAGVPEIGQMSRKRYTYEVLNYLDYYSPLFHIFPIELVNIIYEFHRYPLEEEYSVHDWVELEYELCYGDNICVGSERFRAPEILFQPKLCDNDLQIGVVDCIINSIALLKDPKIQATMFNNIVLCGGSSLLNGIGNRIKLDLIKKLKRDKELFPFLEKSDQIGVLVCKRRDLANWIGASIMSSSLCEWISKEEYEELGAEVVLRKCQL